MENKLRKMKKLPLPDQRCLDAAEGWLGLGDHMAANEELEQISPELRAHPVVLKVQYMIFETAKKWEEAAEIAQTMAKLLPENPWGPFHLAYSLHELKRTQAAYDTLKPVADRFPNEWLMRYNLACYACQLGHLKEAEQWLGKAIDLANKKDIRQMALEDEDLKPLWEKLRGLD